MPTDNVVSEISPAHWESLGIQLIFSENSPGTPFNDWSRPFSVVEPKLTIDDELYDDTKNRLIRVTKFPGVVL